MPKSVKWGIVIAICMLVLFLAGIIFRDQIIFFLQDMFRRIMSGEATLPSPDMEETMNPFGR